MSRVTLNFIRNKTHNVEQECYRFVVKDEKSAGDGTDNVIHTRTYDLHITYDKFYQVTTAGRIRVINS